MTRNSKLLLLAALAVLAVGVWQEPAFAGKLQDAIAAAPHGVDKGQIDAAKPVGFLGIPGGPQVNLIVAFLWAVWVGWIFSTVGAFGGVMAGVGHMTIFGLGGYAKTFKETSRPEQGDYRLDSRFESIPGRFVSPHFLVQLL